MIHPCSTEAWGDGESPGRRKSVLAREVLRSAVGAGCAAPAGFAGALTESSHAAAAQAGSSQLIAALESGAAPIAPHALAHAAVRSALEAGTGAASQGAHPGSMHPHASPHLAAAIRSPRARAAVLSETVATESCALAGFPLAGLPLRCVALRALALGPLATALGLLAALAVRAAPATRAPFPAFAGLMLAFAVVPLGTPLRTPFGGALAHRLDPGSSRFGIGASFGLLRRQHAHRGEREEKDPGQSFHVVLEVWFRVRPNDASGPRIIASRLHRAGKRCAPDMYRPSSQRERSSVTVPVPDSRAWVVDSPVGQRTCTDVPGGIGGKNAVGLGWPR